MTPNELYALPTLASRAFHQLSWLEGAGLLDMDGIDRAAARAAGDERVLFEAKLECDIDGGERSATVAALTFDGRPFAYLCTAGRGESDFSHVVVTDPAVHRDALAHVARWHAAAVEFDLGAPDDRDPALDGFHGTSVVRVGDGVRLVASDRASPDGALLFDDLRFEEAMEKVLRPAFETETREFKAGLRTPRMRILANQVVLAGLPGDARVVPVDRRTRDGSLVVAAFATSEATYTVSIPDPDAPGLAWAHPSVRRRGDPEAIEEIRREMERATEYVP